MMMFTALAAVAAATAQPPRDSAEQRITVLYTYPSGGHRLVEVLKARS